MSFGRLLVALDDSSRCKRALARHLFACHNWTNIPWMISASLSMFSTTFIARKTNCQLSGRRRQRFIPHGKVSCRTYRYRWLKWHIVTINNSDREETDTRTLSFAIALTFAQPWESSKPFRYSSVYAAQMFAWTVNGLTSFTVLSKGKLFGLNRKFLLPTKVPSSHNEHSLRRGEKVWGKFPPRRPYDFRITRAVSQSASSVLGDRKRCTRSVPLQEARARYPATSHDPSKQDNWDPGPLAVKPQRFH